MVYVGRSLDGFIARPDGGIDWLGEPGGDEEDYGWSEFIADVDHIVMGRVTFEQLVGFGAWHYGDTRMTVLSTMLKAVPEGLSDKVDILAAAPPDVLDLLSQQGFRRVYIDGGRTIQGFLRADLIDELVVTTLPVLIGTGIPLFGPLDDVLLWSHTSTETFKNGLVKSSYRRDR